MSTGCCNSLPDAVTAAEAAADPEPGWGGRGCPRRHFPALGKHSQHPDRALAWTSRFLISWGPLLSMLGWFFFFLLIFFLFCLYFLFICFGLPSPSPPFFVICNDVPAQLTFDLHFLINICNSFLKKGIFSWLGLW